MTIRFVPLLLLASTAWGGTNTANYSFYKPSRGEVGWDTQMNLNLDLIDSTVKTLSNQVDGYNTDFAAEVAARAAADSAEVTARAQADTDIRSYYDALFDQVALDTTTLDADLTSEVSRAQAAEYLIALDTGIHAQDILVLKTWESTASPKFTQFDLWQSTMSPVISILQADRDSFRAWQSTMSPVVSQLEADRDSFKTWQSTMSPVASLLQSDRDSFRTWQSTTSPKSAAFDAWMSTGSKVYDNYNTVKASTGSCSAGYAITGSYAGYITCGQAGQSEGNTYGADGSSKTFSAAVSFATTTAVYIASGTTTNRPADMANHKGVPLRFNFTLGLLEYYNPNDAGWKTIVDSVTADACSTDFASNTGATKSVVSSTQIWTFTGSGSWTPKAGCNGNVRILVVGGGGGAWWSNSSGGGAGGYFTSRTVNVTAGTQYTVTVGDGAAGGCSTKGSDSVFGSTTAYGGGCGSSAGGDGRNGGSGGGAGYNTGTPKAQGQPTVGQGNQGGAGTSSAYYCSGGGGGAGAQGGTINGTVCGSGGVGLQNDIDGTLKYYAGGGGASASAQGGTKGSGGSGGGGAGAATNENAGTAGTDGLGGGAGGGYGGSAGAKGGSGIVIISYLPGSAGGN